MDEDELQAYMYSNSVEHIQHRVDSLFEEFDTNGDKLLGTDELHNDIEAVCVMISCPKIDFDPNDEGEGDGLDEHDEL